MEFVYDDGGRKNAGYVGLTGDCVCRAIAIATQKPYQEVYDELNLEIKSYSARSARVKRSKSRSSSRNGVGPTFSHKYLQKLGWVWVPTVFFGVGCKIHLKDGEVPMGRLIVRLSKHLCAVIDGVVHDIYQDDRGGTRCVYGYWHKPNL